MQDAEIREPGVVGRRKRNRLVAGVLAIVFVVVSGAALILGSELQFAIFPSWEQAWLEKVAAALVTLVFLAVLHFRGILSFREAGFVARINPGSALPALMATLLSIVFVIALSLLTGVTFAPFTADVGAVVYQATAPGIAEELVYRGVLISLLGLVFVKRFRLFGASFGWALILQAVPFALIHGLGGLFAVGYSFVLGLVLGWIRERTGSLWPCIVAHNAINVASTLLFFA